MNKSNSFKDTSNTSVFCLDVGNSGLKWAVMQQGSWTKINKQNHNEVDKILELLNSDEVSPQQILISSVVKQTEQKLRELELDPQPFFTNVHQIDPKFLAYNTPGTLGIDRYLACLGAWIQSSGRGVVVIDAGTACTIDLMDAEMVYQGGVIMPGLGLFEHGLKNYAKALPEVKRVIPDLYPGKSTEECLQWGITGSFMGSVLFHLNRMNKKIESPDFYVTGGDSELLAQYISKTYQLKIDNHLVMKGLLKHFNNVNDG